ncbi:MAG: PIG-L family deacetylase [Acidimicrobiales bacterium]
MAGERTMPATPPATPPATLLCLHAHPDDEAMLTGELLAKAAEQGWRTIVVYGTRGDAGETEADLGRETLGERRAREATAACEQLGVARVAFLDHADSGMAGTDTNRRPDAFCNAATDDVAAAVAALVAEEDVLAVVGYDANGTYGHPDHLQVHRSAHAVAARLGVPWLIEATWNREQLAALDGTPPDPGFASAAAELTHFVQGEPWFRAKMEAVKCHASQRRRSADPRPKRTIDLWRARFGTEWFIARPLDGGAGPGPLADLLDKAEDWPGPLVRPPDPGAAD